MATPWVPIHINTETFLNDESPVHTAQLTGVCPVVDRA